jgi:hypothetical protein
MSGQKPKQKPKKDPQAPIGEEYNWAATQRWMASISAREDAERQAMQFRAAMKGHAWPRGF